MSALQIYDDIQPPYAATVFVELYSDSSRLYACMYICILGNTGHVYIMWVCT